MQTSGEAPKLLRDVAYERLRDAITHGDLLPSTPLSEIQLAKEMDISRTPIREALQQLAREGLVKAVPGHAVSVAAPSIKEVMDVVHMRYILEPELARLAAKYVTADMKKTLEQTIEQMALAARKGDRAAWVRLDTLFHEVLSEACPNKLLSKQTMQMRNRVRYMINDPQTDLTRLAVCTEEHEAIVDAILAGDEERAESATRAHIEQLRISLIERFAHI